MFKYKQASFMSLDIAYNIVKMLYLQLLHLESPWKCTLWIPKTWELVFWLRKVLENGSEMAVRTWCAEREQNRNQATADFTRPSPSTSGTDQSRVSLPTHSAGLVVDTSDSFTPTHQDDTAATTGSNAMSAGTPTNDAESATAGLADDEPRTPTDECCSNTDSRGKKRYT